MIIVTKPPWRSMLRPLWRLRWLVGFGVVISVVLVIAIGWRRDIMQQCFQLKKQSRNLEVSLQLAQQRLDELSLAFVEQEKKSDFLQWQQGLRINIERHARWLDQLGSADFSDVVVKRLRSNGQQWHLELVVTQTTSLELMLNKCSSLEGLKNVSVQKITRDLVQGHVHIEFVADLEKMGFDKNEGRR